LVLILNGLKIYLKSLNISSLKTCFIVTFSTTSKHFRLNLFPLEKNLKATRNYDAKINKQVLQTKINPRQGK